MNYRKDFPIFGQRPDLIYLDNAATSQKPHSVLLEEKRYYEEINSNINRSANFLADLAAIAYEKTRKTVADFIGADKKHEIIFTGNATESINLVAVSYGNAFLEPGDEVLLSRLEHHSNIVPWLQLKERKGIKVRYLNVDKEGQYVFNENDINADTKLVSLSGMSNSLGSIPKLSHIIDTAHKKGAVILVDACQLAVHRPIDVQEMNADFLVFSAHKLYGPTGVGVLYGKAEILRKMPAFMGGGEMIREVFEDHFTVGDIPAKFEAGTPNIAGVITFRAALDYINEIGFDTIRKIEKELTEYTLKKLKSLPYITLIGPQTEKNRGSVISFIMKNVHPHDISEGLSQHNVCIRAGHHCCQILMDYWNLPGTARISLAFYNTKEDIDKAIIAIEETYKYFH